MHNPERINEALSISAVSDIVYNDQTGTTKRRSDKFTGKLNPSSESNKTNESVGGDVPMDPISIVAQGNVRT